MRSLGKLIGVALSWRWTPAVGLSVASLVYVLIAVAVVPDEIFVPVTNARFTSKLPAPERREAVVAEPDDEVDLPPAPPPVHTTAAAADFGRRGFSPPLPRPEPPPPPPPPPVAAPVPPAPVMPVPAPEAVAPGPAPVAAEQPAEPEAPAAAPTSSPPTSGLMRALGMVRGVRSPVQPPAEQQPPPQEPGGTEPAPAPPPEQEPPAAPPEQ